MAASVITSAAVALDLVSPFTLYFNLDLVLRKLEVWRFFTTFVFFGQFGFDFAWHMYFLVRYSQALEEGSFRRKTSQYVWMLSFGALMMGTMAPFLRFQFLGPCMSTMMVYVWGRRNRFVRMSLMGVFNFTAPYLPWVMFLLSLLLGHSATEDLMGIAVGHMYYFFEDVYPTVADIRGYRVRRWLAAPKILQQVCGELRNESETPHIVANENVINAEPNVGNGVNGEVEGEVVEGEAQEAQVGEQEQEPQANADGGQELHQHRD